jgi:hypothetical protein
MAARCGVHVLRFFIFSSETRHVVTITFSVPTDRLGSSSVARELIFRAWGVITSFYIYSKKRSFEWVIKTLLHQ